MKKTAKEVAQLIGGEVVGQEDLVITGINSIEDAKQGDLTFADSKKHAQFIEKTNASCVITTKNIEKSSKTIIRTENPSLAFAKILSMLYDLKVKHPRGIHSSAIIEKGVSLGKDVSIGACSVISEGSQIGDKTVIYPGCYVGPRTKIGSSCVIYPQTVIRDGMVIGNKVIIHSGSVIGADGFGYHQLEGKHIKVPQIGNVVIEDDVEIGSCVTIDRATLGQTVIGQGTKIDNLVQVAHNVKLGKNCILVSQAGISGSCKLGDNVILGGQVGVVDHVSLGDKSMVAAKAGVTKSFPSGTILIGVPAKPYREGKKILAASARLPHLMKKIEDLDRKIKELEKKP